jgi:hypothetical protein
MRSTKLTAAGIAAAALLTLAPAIASAAGGHGSHRTRHASAGSCRATLNVAPRLITAGESVVAYGRLSCATAAEEEKQTVTLYQGSVPPDTVAGTGTTEAKGFFKIEIAHVTASTVFHATVGSALSRSRPVKVAAQVTLNGPAEGTQLVTGRGAGDRNRVAFTGSVSPEDAGATVVLQRQNADLGNEWQRIQFGHVGAGGVYAITHTFLIPGDANIRVLVRAGHHNVASPSNVLTYEISQAQSPLLTIKSSVDPLAYGQPVGISGTVAGITTATTVTLMARSSHQDAFAPVAQVKTDASGNYEFPAQSPINSTFYEVEGDGRTSAQIYELVHDDLTATVLPGTTVPAGTTLKFEGSVSPEHPGHVIYLERQNASGTGFHVVEVSTLTADSTYAIAHTIYTTGTSVFRVRIPGDPQNGGTISQQFTITVTPAPSPAALPPEAPGNSTLPPEGQV